METTLNRIDSLFQTRRETKRAALIFYVTAGYPDLDFTVELIPKLAEWGCDLVELGVPFSDPIADGPTIQHSSSESLKAGTTTKKILERLPEIRSAAPDLPLVLFSALNPILIYGEANLARDAAGAGVDGLLFPDLPPEEGARMAEIAREQGLTLTFLAAPTSPAERLRAIADASSGFIYYIARRGVTGASDSIADDLAEKIAALKGVTDKPIAVGFGVSTPDHARQVAEHADGVIVGSALINKIREGVDQNIDRAALMDQLGEYVRSLADALR